MNRLRGELMRKAVHISMGGFALLFRWITPGQAAILAIVALGLMIGVICRGHFIMPHPDFFEMVDSGRAIIDGRLPPTLKRAPVFSTLVAAAGALLPFEAPERVAAEWIN
ncbi:MAG: hypothetical protein IH848_06240, partial [Acidobacteria bacterium]|nr:hypothetical protein [Acidobacteriota bacterium]